jgi:sugar phosphate isomerase/epimerase
MEPSIIALLTDALEDRPLEAVAEWCAARGIGGLELGVGGYSPAPHVDALRAGVDLAGLGVVALNASGNPLHPDREVREAHDGALRSALRLAAELGVPRVVAMSGCPGSGDWPVFAGGAWLPDMEGLWDRQWPQIAAYWEELSAWAPAGVDICLELHPGTSIYNAASFALLAEVTGSNVKVNLDPSHFWWQGIDPVATVRALPGRIGFAHGKDTLVHAGRVARHGVLDFRWPADADTMAWHFCAVGDGHDTAAWADLLGALRAAGHDGAVSIEHEDPRLEAEAGIEASLQGLRAALAGLEQPA